MRVTESKQNTCYLTAGGYLVTLDERLIAPKELCPGTNVLFNKPATTGLHGWVWDENGSIGGLSGDWNEKLRIIAELPFGIPKLPSGYGWKGGYPVLRKPEPGEEYLSPYFASDHTNSSYRHGHAVRTSTNTIETQELGHKRLIVEAHPSPPKTEDKYAKYATFPVEVKTEVLMDSVEDTKFHKDNNITTVVFPAVEVREDVKPNSVFSDECICSIMNFDANFNTSKKDYTSGANPSVKGRQSRLSYFITEPLANTYKLFKPSFRYVLLYSTIAAIVYSAANFETVVNLIKSCLPKVSIEWNETNLSGAKNVKSN